jgi:hypothetical protein
MPAQDVRMFEHRTSPLLPRKAFFRRLGQSLLIGCSLLAVALGIGIIGYHFLEQLGWLDAFVNAAMILSGMGPLTPLQTSAGKLFAGCYALFSGLLFLTVAGIILAPIGHRLMHKFHLEAAEKKKS